MQSNHPLIELRRRIRRAGKQFRQNNDNSRSIFHPAGGFVYGYDIAEVEAALDAFEEAMPSELQPQPDCPVRLMHNTGLFVNKADA
jgi:hypothetical protein